MQARYLRELALPPRRALTHQIVLNRSALCKPRYSHALEMFGVRNR